MKRLSLLTLAALLGTSACVNTTTICGTKIEEAASDLNAALLAHPETPAAVGEPATDIVIGVSAACSQ